MADGMDTLPDETWKPISGLEGLYEVSDLGRVRSLPRMIRPRANGLHARYLKPGRILRQFTAHHGYKKVVLSVDGRQVQKLIHVAVCEAFHGPRPDGHQASHRNGLAGDNRPDNLRWLTTRENNAEKAKHGTVTRGDTNPTAKLDPDIVRAIRRRNKSGDTASQIARDIGVTHNCVAKVIHGKTWGWVT